MFLTNRNLRFLTTDVMSLPTFTTWCILPLEPKAGCIDQRFPKPKVGFLTYLNQRSVRKPKVGLGSTQKSKISIKVLIVTQVVTYKSKICQYVEIEDFYQNKVLYYLNRRSVKYVSSKHSQKFSISTIRSQKHN